MRSALLRGLCNNAARADVTSRPLAHEETGPAAGGAEYPKGLHHQAPLPSLWCIATPFSAVLELALRPRCHAGG